MMQKVSR